MKLLSVIYYLGIIACGIQGSKKSCYQHKWFCLPTSFLAAMGGGIIRDLFILFVFPAAFTMSCMPDVTIALCAGLIYRLIPERNKVQNILRHLVILIDALGVGSFIALGVDKALSLGATQDIAFCCGIITALGGGILSALICGQTIREVMTTNVTYRIITISSTLLYLYCLSIGINQIVAQYWLILHTASFISISSYTSIDILIRFISAIKCLKTLAIVIPAFSILYKQNACTLFISPYLMTHYFYNLSYYSKSKCVLYIRHTNVLLNIRLRCPRRFARGR